MTVPEQPPVAWVEKAARAVKATPYMERYTLAGCEAVARAALLAVMPLITTVAALDAARLVDVATDRVRHLYRGQCPDFLDGHDRRDPDSPACAALPGLEATR